MLQPGLAGETGHDNSPRASPQFGPRHHAKRNLTEALEPAASSHLGTRRAAATFGTLSKPLDPSMSWIARQAFTCRAAQDSDDQNDLTLLL